MSNQTQIRASRTRIRTKKPRPASQGGGQKPGQQQQDPNQKPGSSRQRIASSKVNHAESAGKVPPKGGIFLWRVGHALDRRHTRIAAPGEGTSVWSSLH